MNAARYLPCLTLLALAACGAPSRDPAPGATTPAPTSSTTAASAAPIPASGPLVVERTTPPGACTPSGLCWEHPRPLGPRWNDVAIVGEGAIAVGPHGALARLSVRSGEIAIELADPIDTDLELVRAADDVAVAAGDGGWVSVIDPALTVTRLPRVFPEHATGAVLDLWAGGRDRIVVAGLHGAIAEHTSAGWTDRSVRSSDAGVFAAGADGALAVAAGRTFSWRSDPSAPSETIPFSSEAVSHLVVIDRTRAFALGMQGGIAERDATGWHELMPRTPRTITPGQAFVGLVVLDAASAPVVLVLDGHGAVFSRAGWYADGSTFAQEPVPWPAPRARYEHDVTARWLVALDDGRVLAGGSALAIRSADGTWRAAAEGAGTTYSRCAATGHEAWAVGWRGAIAHFDGERWISTDDTQPTQSLLALAASGEAVLAATSHGLLVRDGSAWRAVELPPELAGNFESRAIAAREDGAFVVTGEVREAAACVVVRGGSASPLPCDGAPITSLVRRGDGLVGARGTELLQLDASGAATPLGVTIDVPVDDEDAHPEITALLPISDDELLVATSSMGVFVVRGGRARIDHPLEREPVMGGGRMLSVHRILTLAQHEGIVYGGTSDGRVLRRARAGRWVEVPVTSDTSDGITWLGTIGGTLWALGEVGLRLQGGHFERVTLPLRATTALTLADGSALLGGPDAAIVRVAQGF